MLKKISLGMASAFTIVLVAAILPTAIWYASPWQAWRRSEKVRQPSPERAAVVINRVNEGSFGRLTAQTGSTTAPAGAGLSVAVGRGGGGGLAMDKVGLLPPGEFKNYRFVYKGKEFSLEDKAMPVLKRQRAASASVDVPTLVSGLGFGLADLGSLQDLRLQNVSLIERKDFGYLVNVTLDDGSVSIMQNWEFWPAGRCGNDTACYEAQRVRIGDILPDDRAIAIAEAFLTDRGIDRSLYAEPQVLASWRLGYEAAQNKSEYYLPETVEVVYPLKIQDKSVRDEYSGWKQGLTVSVHNKTGRVASVFGLTTQTYDSADYEIEADAKKLIAYAEKGGAGNYPVEGGKIEELSLGDPETCYIRYYSYQGGQTAELLVPALAFPVVNPPTADPNFMRQAVVVPLAKDILAERETMLPPMPLTEKAASATSSDSD